ncbi:hypothetical protein QFZ35_001726 [Arthrobacter ulcerisalmonis]|nr:hypothetical protein [Arthrobacter ulcerisalmonis]MDQ0663228.1 hypothetical protein [Arthrobacter ulcerisalmonis]
MASSRTTPPITRHQFSFARSFPGKANQKVRLPAGTVTDLIQLITAINPGNSGGPLLLMYGSVGGCGEFQAGVGAWHPDENDYGAEARDLPHLHRGRRHPAHHTAAPARRDGQAQTPSSNIINTNNSDHEQARRVIQSLLIHEQSINPAAYGTALSVLAPELEPSEGGLAKSSSGLGSSFLGGADGQQQQRFGAMSCP